ncbi:MAG: hypothetical protein JWP44_3609 [Mucilaginibacter sp.]|nr:hypothetical protein [Mucilaginibacter sp.]
MIIVELQGGLGNQMFQYACGKALSIKHNQKLLIDLTFLQQNQLETEGFTPRLYELGIFRLDTEVAGKQLIKSFTGESFYKKIFKLLKLPLKECYCEIPGKGASQMDKIAFPVLLKGYWQSEYYFSDYKNEIRKAFKFDIESVTEIQDTIAQINQTNSVSIHFRRGDYLTNPVAKKVLGPLDIDYYKEAISKIQSEIEKPFFFIFSDDPEWVKENFPLSENYKVIDGSHKDKPYHDMLLMSKCKHHIISNSSFSWWGAWLNPDPQKVVIAPKRWFADEHMNITSTNLVPGEWIRI